MKAKTQKHGIKLCQEERQRRPAERALEDAMPSAGACALRRSAPVKMSIATISLSGDLVEKLEAIASAGFAGVEVFDQRLSRCAQRSAFGRMPGSDVRICRLPQTFELGFFPNSSSGTAIRGFGAVNAPIRLAAQSRLIETSIL